MGSAVRRLPRTPYRLAALVVRRCPRGGRVRMPTARSPLQSLLSSLSDGEKGFVMSRSTKQTSDGLRVDRLPGVGPRYEVGTLDGQRLTVVIDRHGDRHISLGSGSEADSGASAVISARQSSLLALILTNTFEMAEAEFPPVEGRPASAGAEFAAR